MKVMVTKLVLVSMLATILVVVLGAVNAQPYYSGKSAHVDEHWFDVSTSPAGLLGAFLAGTIDAGDVLDLTSLLTLAASGFTITQERRLGYTLLMENNRRWPFGGVSWDDPLRGGCGYGSPTEPWATNAMYF